MVMKSYPAIRTSIAEAVVDEAAVAELEAAEVVPSLEWKVTMTTMALAAMVAAAEVVVDPGEVVGEVVADEDVAGEAASARALITLAIITLAAIATFEVAEGAGPAAAARVRRGGIFERARQFAVRMRTCHCMNSGMCVGVALARLGC